MASRDPALRSPRVRASRLRPSSARIFLLAARTGLGDLRTNYTWWSWTIGWLIRCVIEVAFFGLIGLLLADPSVTLFLLVGRGLFIGVAEMMWTIQSTAWERGSGTLPLLVAAPGRVWPVFAGRSTQWLASAMTTSLVCLLVLPPLFGILFEPAEYLAIVVAVPATILTSYGFALPVAALMVRRPSWRNAASNVVHTTMGLICGSLVPVAFWPLPVQWLAQAFPVTHALAGLRSVLDPAAAPAGATLWGGLGLALVLGAVYFALGAVLLERFAEAARNGRIDIDS